MNYDLFDYTFFCPYCNATISMLLDPSTKSQAYIEDCEVCCNPIEISYKFNEDGLEFFQANSIEQ